MEDNVRVAMVEPVAVETELADLRTDEEAQEGISALYQLDILQPEYIARASV